MENKNKTAFGYGFCTANGESHSESEGLTKREYIATMAMQGLLARDGWAERIISEGNSHHLKEITHAATLCADELLKQLEAS